jgi:hypothetical protein
VDIRYGGVCAPRDLVAYASPGGETFAWVDGATGDLLKVLPFDVQTPDIRARRARESRRIASVVDSRGRSVWIDDGRLAREGDATGTGPELRKSFTFRRVPGGWYGYEWDANHTFLMLVDAERYEVKRVPWPGEVSGTQFHLLSPRRALVWRVPPSRKGGAWNVLDLDAGREAVAVNPPDATSFLAPLPGGRALVRRGPAGRGPRTLVAWDPVTGEDRPILGQDGASITCLQPWLLGTAADGRILLSAPTWVILDPETLVAGPAPVDGSKRNFNPVALDADGSLVVVDANRSCVVRCGPEQGTETVLFPR